VSGDDLVEARSPLKGHMRRDQFLVFDEVISAVSGPTQAYTAATFNRRLATHNQFGFQVVIDNVLGASPTFDLWVEHSPDGRTWLQHSDTAQTLPPTQAALSGDISFTTALLTSATVHTRMYSNAVFGLSKTAVATASGPLLSNVRLSMKLGGTNVSAHVKVYAVFRS
jgi:hypothetical protein